MLKGGLSNDVIISTIIKPNATIMVLGTPDSQLTSKPKQISKFIEDLGPEAQTHHFHDSPTGFKNLGNTCYLNATLQALFCIKPLQEKILNFEMNTILSGADLHTTLIYELKTCFQVLKERKQESFTPIMLLSILRRCYPQFAERDPQTGFYKQQDAEELLTQLFHSFQQVFGQEFSDKFQIRFRTTIKDSANEDDIVVKEDKDMKLQCHIGSNTNFLKNGIMESLKEKIEKRSRITNVDSIFEVEKKITKLPEYLTIQYVRFFWKKSSSKKSKILRKVVFPFQLDVADLLTKEYAEEKIKIREDLREVEKNKLEEEHELTRVKVSSDDCPPMAQREEFETKKALIQSKQEYWLNEFSKKFPENLQFGENPSCVYDLIGVITHQGPNSESGHYQAFIRDEMDATKWYKFNDDKVSIIDKEKIESLAGGGESDSALILIYKGLGL